MGVTPSQGLDGGRAARLPGRTERPRWVPATSMVCLLALVMASTSAHAAGPTGTDEALSAEARKHYEEGTKAFNLAEFPRAIAEFKAAYNAKPDPLLLFNIAQAFRLGGDDAQALLFYKSFLRNMPDAPNRKEVEARIRTLEKAVAEQQQRQAEQQKREAAVATVPPAVGTTATPPPASAAETGTTPGRATGAAAIDLRPSAPPPAGGSAQPALVPPPLAPASNASQLAGASSESTPTTGATSPDMTDGRDTTGSKPFFKRPWFWVAVGAVVVVTIAIAGNADKQPSTALGLYAPTFQ